MSVHARGLARGAEAFDVRWRSPLDGANCSRRFDSEAEAAGFDAAMRARLALDRAQAAWVAIPDRWKAAVAEELEAEAA